MNGLGSNCLKAGKVHGLFIVTVTSQSLFSHVGTEHRILGINQYYWKLELTSKKR